MRIHNPWTAILRLACRLHRRGVALGFALALSLALLVTGPPTFAQFNNNSSSFGSSSNSSYGNNSSSSSSFGRSNSSSFGRNNNSSSGSGSNSSFGRNRNGSSSDSSKSSRNRKAKTKDTKGVAGQPARARTQGKSTVVKRKGGGKKKEAKGGKEMALPEIKLDPGKIDDAIYFSPQFMHVAPGDRFITSLVYFNSKSNPTDEVKLWVHYDPLVLTPDWIDTGTLNKNFKGRPEITVWRQEGYISFHCKLVKPLVATENPLAEFHWQAIKAATTGTPIATEAPAGEEIALLAAGKNVIERTGQGIMPCVNANVIVTDPNQEGTPLQLVSDITDAMLPPPSGITDRLRLAVMPLQKDVAPGETSMADIVLLNPSHLQFDELKFRIRFSPDDVLLLDADADNYISEGINIFDGDFHEQFPFGEHYENNVDLERGAIGYHVASANGPQTYPSGTLARIVYRMKRSGGQAAFWFETVDPTIGSRVTDVTLLGRSLLGQTTGLARDALNGALIAVRPTTPSDPLAPQVSRQ